MSKKNLPEKSVLVVDDDQSFRDALKKAIEQSGNYKVTTVPNGKSAQQLITVQEFAAIVSDIRMPEGNGIELTHFVKRTKKIPIILMTGFAEIAETKEAHELGADGFLPKPFKKEDLLQLLETICYTEKEKFEAKEHETSDELFCKLNIDDFISGREIKYDIYIRLGQDKYIKIANHGEDLSTDRIARYKAKNMRYLYLQKSDFRKYVNFNVALSGAVTKSRLEKQKKLNLLKHTGEVVLSEIYLDGVNEESFDIAKTVVENTIDVLTDSSDILNMLTLLNSHTDFLYSHSLGVSLYSAMIAREMGWGSQMTQFKVSMGALFHDIGKKEIDAQILQKPRKDLTAEEIRLIETHPVRGRDILSQMGSISSDLLLIALQHHENCLGLGYPRNLKLKHIHPLARLISVANEFCNLTIKNPNCPVPLKAPEAIQKMASVMGEQLDQQCFRALRRVLGDRTAKEPKKKSA